MRRKDLQGSSHFQKNVMYPMAVDQILPHSDPEMHDKGSSSELGTQRSGFSGPLIPVTLAECTVFHMVLARRSFCRNMQCLCASCSRNSERVASVSPSRAATTASVPGTARTIKEEFSSSLLSRHPVCVTSSLSLQAAHIRRPKSLTTFLQVPG